MITPLRRRLRALGLRTQLVLPAQLSTRDLACLSLAR